MSKSFSKSYFFKVFDVSLLKPLTLFFLIVLFSSVEGLSQSITEPIEKSSYENPDHDAGNYLALKKGWFVGADFGTSLFYGDVTLYNYFPKKSDFRKSTGSAMSLSGGKKFKWGLAAEIQLSKGNLKGQKIADNLYPRYFNADYMSYSVNAKYNLSQLVFRKKNDRKFYNRLTVFATVGGGQIFFRSRLYKLALNEKWYLERVSGFTSTGIDSAGVGVAGGLVADRAKTVSALIVPVGGKINFKLNNKTDVVLNVNYVTAFTDQLDSWTRSWSHKDRYLYTGIGLIFNIGSEEESDVPDKDRFLKNKIKLRGGKKKSGEESSSNSKSNDDGDDDLNKRIGLFNKKSSDKKSGSNSKEDKDLEIKLKMYELQLKLFEMQYLMK